VIDGLAEGLFPGLSASLSFRQRGGHMATRFHIVRAVQSLLWFGAFPSKVPHGESSPTRAVCNPRRTPCTLSTERRKNPCGSAGFGRISISPNSGLPLARPWLVVAALSSASIGFLSFIRMNWKGRRLVTSETVVNLIGGNEDQGRAEREGYLGYEAIRAGHEDRKRGMEASRLKPHTFHVATFLLNPVS